MAAGGRAGWEEVPQGRAAGAADSTGAARAGGGAGGVLRGKPDSPAGVSATGADGGGVSRGGGPPARAGLVGVGGSRRPRGSVADPGTEPRFRGDSRGRVWPSASFFFIFGLHYFFSCRRRLGLGDAGQWHGKFQFQPPPLLRGPSPRIRPSFWGHTGRTTDDETAHRARGGEWVGRAGITPVDM